MLCIYNKILSLKYTHFFSYREASVEVIEVMSRFAVIERASIDEAYMDLTASVKQRLRSIGDVHIQPHLLKSTFIQGYPQTTINADETEDAALDNGLS